MPEPAGMSGPGTLQPAVGKGSGGPGGKEDGDANPFAEYMWMENEEDYNRQVEEELLEQEFLERCFQEMLEEEDQDWFIPSRDLHPGQGQGAPRDHHHPSMGQGPPRDYHHPGQGPPRDYHHPGQGPPRDYHHPGMAQVAPRDVHPGLGRIQQQLNGLSLGERRPPEDVLRKSSLNPEAKEFVPGMKY